MFIFQEAGYISIWVAVIAAVASIVGTLGLGTIVVWKLNKSKFLAEVKGQETKNYGDFLTNHNIENKAIAEAMGEIALLRKTNLELGSENHRLVGNNQIKDIQIARAQGATELALKERDDVVGRIKTLEEKVEFEHNQCQQQIMELGLRYMSEINHLKQILSDNNITVTPMPTQTTTNTGNELNDNTGSN